MLIAAICWLSCLALFVEVTDRAPTIEWMD